MTDGGFKSLSQRDDLVMHGAACGRFPRRRCFYPVDPVLLRLSGSDLGKPEIAEEGDQMDTKAGLVAFDPTRAAMPFSDNFVLSDKLLGGLFEGLLGANLAAQVFAAKLQIPVLGKILRACQAFFLGAGTPVLAGKVGRALPETADLTLTNVNLASQNRV